VRAVPREPKRSPHTALLLAALVLPATAWRGQARAQPAEQITVTAAPSDRSPTGTTILGADDIARSGVSGIGTLLDQVPAFGSQGVNGAQNDGGFGEYFVDLRNLNFDRTLVLVDGNRFVLSGIQTDEAVDLNDIPTGFIDHVEVLQDGTQPRYAADAVAGVVNIVLKDQVEGWQLDSYGAAAGAGDAGTGELSLVGGHGFAGGHVAIGLDFYQRGAVRQSDRDWSQDPIASAMGTASGTQLLFGSPATPGGHAVGDGIDALALGDGRTRAYDPATDDYNFASGRDLAGGLQREVGYFDADAMLSDSVTGDVELLFADRRATTLQPPQTLGLTGTLRNPDGFVIPASDPFNPFGAPVTLERVVSEAGPQTTTTSGPVWRVLGGLHGSLAGWDWSLSVDQGQSLSRYTTGSEINLTRALQTAGNGACPASVGCVEADWFGPDSLSPAALAYITYTARSQSSYAETVGQGRLSGPILSLPGGRADLALGVEVRRESGATSVDAVTARGDQAGADAAPTSGAYETAEAYATLAAPLLRNRAWARRLDLSLAARETATSRYGSFTTLRAALDYEPASGIRLHAVTGTARRPPAISEAFGGVTAALQPVTDPCSAESGLRRNPVVDANCRSLGLGPGFTQASPLINVESGGNPHLHPEQSENEELGLTLAPPGLDFLSASVDYYHYRIRDAIDSLADTDPDLIPDSCFESLHLSSPYCGLISRIAGGGNAGQIGSILARDENVGTIKTDGLEFGATVRTPASPLGRLRIGWQTNWLLDYRLHDLGQSGFVQYAGTFPGLVAVGSYARIRSRATAELSRGDWSLGWTGRYIAGARVLGESGEPFSKAPGILYQDVELTHRFGRLVAMCGIDNIADKAPPTLIDGETNTDTSTYDVLGRVFWGRVTYSF
jgi:outer membrane receptor protein involved in Fe transport